MKKTIVGLLIVVFLFPLGQGFSQFDDRPPTLGLEITNFSPFFYKDSEGYTIIIGEIKNTRNFPVTEVKVWGGFYDDLSLQPIESSIGTTILEVIPPNSAVPYTIKSATPNPSITNISVNVLGFNSGIEKHQGIVARSISTEVTDKIRYSGELTNTGGVIAENPRIHMVFYDAFIPPRLVGISSQVLEDGIPPNSSISFEFEERMTTSAAGFWIVAESDNLSSNVVDNKITPPEFISKLVTINDVTINDADGNRLTDVTQNSPIFIQSKLSLQSSSGPTQDQPYVYYAQVKESGEKAYVEFIGTFEDTFDGEGVGTTTVEWVPEKKGLFFIETFVWDPNAIPLASKGPVILVLVN